MKTNEKFLKEELNKNKNEQGRIKKEKEQKRIKKNQEKNNVEKKQILKTKIKYKQSNEFSLKIKNIKKQYGFKKVLRGVSFNIKKGERISIIGKNGSGKSTLISIISQQIKMNEGYIHYGYANNKIESLELMGIQFQTLVYPEGFVVKDIIHFFNVSVNKSIRLSKKELSDIISLFGINKYINQKIDKLSGGQQQRINILLALIKKPKLLILDEISTGLDIESSEIIKNYIMNYLNINKDVSLILVSHSDEEIRELTNKVFVLESGKIVEEFPSLELTNEKFLEITSREPKLTKREKEIAEIESNKLLASFAKSYKIKPLGNISQSISNFSNSLFPKNIPNEHMEPNNIIEIRDVSKTYDGKVGAVREFSLDIKKGERIAITGPNGSGKSTIIEIIAQVKSFDKLSNKISNKKKLIWIDSKMEIKKLEEFIDVILRKIKLDYRYKRTEVKNEIDEINKKLLDDLNKMKLKNESDQKEEELKFKIENKIEKLNSNLKKYVDSKKEEYKILEIKLKNKFDNDVKNIKLKRALLLDELSGNNYNENQIILLKENAKDEKYKLKKLNNEKLNEILFSIKKKKEDTLIKIEELKNSNVKFKKQEIIDLKEDLNLFIEEAKTNYEYKKFQMKSLIKNSNNQIDLELQLEINKIKKLSEKNNKNNKIKIELFNDKKILNDKKVLTNKNKKPKIIFSNEIKIKPISYSFAINSREVKDGIGVQFQYASFPSEMSVKDVILFFSRTNKYFLSKDEMLEAIKVFKLEKLLNLKAYKLSGGEKQRLNVLLSIMKSPKLLILDEISTGLDVDSILKIDTFIKNYLDKTGSTLILISHNYHEVHSLTNKIVVMKYGKLLEIVDKKNWPLEKTKNKMRDIYIQEEV